MNIWKSLDRMPTNPPIASTQVDPGFETGREIAKDKATAMGERIRDKIAASKRKGLWVGGVPSLGYDVVNRKLVVNPAEAEVVRRIFTDYPRVGSTTMFGLRPQPRSGCVVLCTAACHRTND